MRNLGGDKRTRTADVLLAGQTLFQLSYIPVSPDRRSAAPASYGPQTHNRNYRILVKRFFAARDFRGPVSGFRPTPVPGPYPRGMVLMRRTPSPHHVAHLSRVAPLPTAVGSTRPALLRGGENDLHFLARPAIPCGARHLLNPFGDLQQSLQHQPSSPSSSALWAAKARSSSSVIPDRSMEAKGFPSRLPSSRASRGFSPRVSRRKRAASTSPLAALP